MLDYYPWWQYLLLIAPLYFGLLWMETQELAATQLDPKELSGPQKAAAFLQMLYPGSAQALVEHLKDPETSLIREESKELFQGVDAAKSALYLEFLDASEPKRNHEWEEFEFEQIINRKIEVNPSDAAQVLKKLWLIPSS